MYMNIIAEDGNTYPFARQQYSLTLAAGKTADALITPTLAGPFALYDRMLNLTNRTPSGVGTLSVAQSNKTTGGVRALGMLQVNENPGSMFTFLEVTAAIVDTDGDGLLDSEDNCTLVANADQRDTDGDNYGNICDGDLNNDGVVDARDFIMFRGAFGTSGPDADFNGDGRVDAIDFVLFRNMYNKPVGPSGLNNI